jgi:hypothetical protein
MGWGGEEGWVGGRKELYIEPYTIWYIILKAVNGFLIFIYTEWTFYKLNHLEA